MVKLSGIRQGDILKIERMLHPILVVSKDFFNESGQIIACPIFDNSSEGALHIWISAKETEGYVQCEKLALLDLKIRGYTKIDNIELDDKMNISDTIQGIFDYI